MARMPGATWRPIAVNFTNKGQASVRGVVIHIMAGTLAGTDSWFRNRQAEASSHFGTGKKGELYQWVDSSDRAWAQAGGNSSWLSIENEGQGGDELTNAQLNACAEVLAWAHKVHDVPLQVADNPSERGLGHHSMGGSAWGSHPSCPGSRIIAQKPEIVRRAKALVGQPSTPKPPSKPATDWTEKAIMSMPTLSKGANGADVKRLQGLLCAAGSKVDIDGDFGPKTLAAVRAEQTQARIGVDGIVGRQTWTALLGA